MFSQVLKGYIKIMNYEIYEANIDTFAATDRQRTRRNQSKIYSNELTLSSASCYFEHKPSVGPSFSLCKAHNLKDLRK